jgi:phage tail sheath protein FI
MPVTPTYPGVYIEEIPRGVRTIVGVATSIAAFVDFFPRGPLNKAVQIFSFADFEREFGGLDALVRLVTAFSSSTSTAALKRG